MGFLPWGNEHCVWETVSVYRLVLLASQNVLKLNESDFSCFSLHISRSFALDRTGLDIRKSTYRSVKKQHALCGPEKEDYSELLFQKVFLILCMHVHYNPTNGLLWVKKL